MIWHRRSLRYGAWIVVGGGPDAREMLNLARRRCPTARIITTNGGIDLFEPPDVPDVYYLNDQEACRVYHDRAVWMQRHGTRLATLRRVPSAMASRRVDGFDEFLPGVRCRINSPAAATVEASPAWCAWSTP